MDPVGSLGDLDLAFLFLPAGPVLFLTRVRFLIWADVMLSHPSLALAALRA